MAPWFTSKHHRPELTTLYRLVQQHAASFVEQAEAAVGADLPQFVKDKFDAFLECEKWIGNSLRPENLSVSR